MFQQQDRRSSGPRMLHPDNAPRRPDIGSSWLEPLAQAFQAESFAQLKTFLLHEQASQVMFPKARDIFAAFNATPFDRVRVVIEPKGAWEHSAYTTLLAEHLQGSATRPRHRTTQEW